MDRAPVMTYQDLSQLRWWKQWAASNPVREPRTMSPPSQMSRPVSSITSRQSLLPVHMVSCGGECSTVYAHQVQSALVRVHLI